MTAVIKTAGIESYDRVHFEWFLVNWCNFKCSYCNAAEMMVDTYSKQNSPSKYKLVLHRLGQLDTDFEMDLFGGEPTLHPEFLHIIQELSEMPSCKLIEIKTNLSKPLHFLQQVFKSNKVRLAASYHAEYYNQSFLDKCIALKDNDFYCHINLSDNPKDWPQILDLITKFDENGVRYDLNILLSTPGYTTSYTPEFYKLFESRVANIADKETYRLEFSDGKVEKYPAFRIYQNGLANFKGYNCKALLYEITAEGDILNSCTRVKMPIVLKKEHFRNTVVCPRHICHADMMLNFYKERSDL